MGAEESDAEIGKLLRECREVTEERVRVVEKIKQIAEALRKLAEAIDRTADLDEVSRDSILQEYLDLSKIGALVAEEQELSAKQEEYDRRKEYLGYY